GMMVMLPYAVHRIVRGGSGFVHSDNGAVANGAAIVPRHARAHGNGLESLGTRLGVSGTHAVPFALLFSRLAVRLRNRLWIARRKALVAAFVDEPLAMLRIVRAGMRRHLRRADLRRGRGRRLRLSAHGDAGRSGIRPGFH